MGSVLNTDDPIIPGEIKLGKVPDDNGGSDYTVRLHYYQQPDALAADAEIPELPEYTHMAIAYKTASMMLYRRGNDQRALIMEGLYDKEIEKAKTFITRKQRDRAYLTPDDMGYGDTEFGV
jgi:hypothetical protein